MGICVTGLFAFNFLANSLSAQSPGQRDFDVTAVSGYFLQNQTATGTSNGISWKICGTSFANCCGASTTGGYFGFNTANFSPPVPGEDALHIGGDDYTILFERPVSSIVFYLRENSGTSSVDFGLTPTVISGAPNLTIVGTRIYPNTIGGAVRFDNVNSRTMTGIAGDYDGMNIAFYVEALSPGPAIAPLCPSDLCVDFPCGNDGQKVQMCHIPSGNPNNAHEICISPSAVPAHLAHGDYCGPCASQKQDSKLAEVGSNELVLDAFPNPFSGNTTLKISVDQPGNATVEVFALDGRLVAKIFDGEVEANQDYSVRFDGDQISEGVYYARLSTENGAIYKKIACFK